MDSISNKETVTVIVPVYNRENLVVKALDSIYSQTYRPLRLIVVDNNSTDSSKNVVRTWRLEHEDKDFQISLIEEMQPGAAAARQKGLVETTTDKVMFFDSDDMMRNELIEKAMEVFAEKPSTDIVYWPVSLHGLGGGIKTTHKSAPGKLLENHLVHSILRTQGYMVRKSFLIRSGGWRGDCMVWNDWELGVRLITSEPVAEPLDYIGADIYSQTESITGMNFKSRAGEWERTIDMIEESLPENESRQREKIIGLLDYRRVILAAHYKREGRSDIGDSLLNRTLSRKQTKAFRRLLLRIIYHYTAIGGRGAFYLYSIFCGA